MSIDMGKVRSEKGDELQKCIVCLHCLPSAGASTPGGQWVLEGIYRGTLLFLHMDSDQFFEINGIDIGTPCSR